MSWVKVEDRLPSVETDVLIWPRPEFNTLKHYVGFYRAGWESAWSCRVGQIYGTYESIIKVTHWHPLPDNPK